MNYLLDSDVLISAAKDHPETRQLLQDVSAGGIAISIISFGELYEGAVSYPDPIGPQKLAQLRTHLHAFPVLNLSEPVMERFARLRAELRQQGQLIPDFDLLIAATALEHGLTLITGNVRHFQRLPGLHLYGQE